MDLSVPNPASWFMACACEGIDLSKHQICVLSSHPVAKAGNLTAQSSGLLDLPEGGALWEQLDSPAMPRLTNAFQLPLFVLGEPFTPSLDKLCSKLAWVSSLSLCCLLGAWQWLWQRLMKGCQLWLPGAPRRKSKEGKRWVRERGDKRKKGGERRREKRW